MKTANVKIKRIVSGFLEDLAGEIVTVTACRRCWGEIELPDCLNKCEFDETKELFN